MTSARSRTAKHTADGDAMAAPARMFATAVPGLGGLLAAEINQAGGDVIHGVGFDGRADVIRFDAIHAVVASLRLCEDAFVQCGHTTRANGDRAGWVADRLCHDGTLRAATALRARLASRLHARPTVRVVARVLGEDAFRRTELRHALTRAVQRLRPQWIVADPADIEMWVVEYRPGRLVAGLRLTGALTRQHGGRMLERPAALRPTVAAAMLTLAGSRTGTLLDPSCGSGTILSAAVTAGWRTLGLDIDPDAVAAACRNVPDAAAIGVADARRLPLGDASVDGYVANLPFGHCHQVPGDPADWLAAVLAEAARVTRPGAAVVLLHPGLPSGSVPSILRRTHRYPIRLLGRTTTIAVYRHRGRERARGDEAG